MAGRGLAVLATVWPGGHHDPIPDAVVVIDADGMVDRIGPVNALSLPDAMPVVGGRGAWVGPGFVDAHVHLSFASTDDELRGGLVAVRDLGSPADLAADWRAVRNDLTAHPLWISMSGPILTVTAGYPSRSWGANGFARFIDEGGARSAVARLVAEGADLIKVALEPSGGAPVPSAEQLRDVVDAAHESGRSVTAHALSVAMVERALDAGVDELCHMPTEGLGQPLMERLVSADVPVVSTLEAFSHEADGTGAVDNAARFVGSGGRLIYGTDLGNAGTRPGIDHRELARLRAAGLSARDVLVAATQGSAGAAGFDGQAGRGIIEVGHKARLTVLGVDPLAVPWSPEMWDRAATVIGTSAHGELSQFS